VIGRPNCVCDYLFDLQHDVLVEIDLRFWIGYCKILLKIVKTHLIKVLELSEILALFLNRIICQMNEFVVQVLQIVFFAACPYIAIFVKVCLDAIIDARYESKYSEVKLSFVN